jgi:hypothetical protein
MNIRYATNHARGEGTVVNFWIKFLEPSEKPKVIKNHINILIELLPTLLLLKT